MVEYVTLTTWLRKRLKTFTEWLRRPRSQTQPTAPAVDDKAPVWYSLDFGSGDTSVRKMAPPRDN